MNIYYVQGTTSLSIMDILIWSLQLQWERTLLELPPDRWGNWVLEGLCDFLKVKMDTKCQLQNVEPSTLMGESTYSPLPSVLRRTLVPRGPVTDSNRKTSSETCNWNKSSYLLGDAEFHLLNQYLHFVKNRRWLICT